MNIEAFYDARTWTLTYLVWDPATRDAVIIDSVLDYDPVRVRVYDESIRKVEARLDELGLTLRWVLDTHAHADHLTGAGVLRRRRGAPIAIGVRITEVLSFFKGVFDLGDEVPADGSQFDRLLADGDVLEAGSIVIRAYATPGHTPACTSYLIGDALFTGDAIFMPDQGTGRCDFPNGSAAQLYDSIQKIYALPPSTRIFVGHDYQPGGRALKYETTVAEERTGNIQLKAETARDTFVEWRLARDKTLNLPNLIYQSLQVNVRAGRLPPAGPNGLRYLKMPMNVFDGPMPEEAL